MIITILFIVMFIVGLILVCLEDRYMFDSILFFFGGLSLLIVGASASIVCVIAVLDVQVNKDVNYQSALYQKEVLEYRIDHMDENIVGNELLYNDIVEYNNDLRFIKEWSDNYWVNWFFNEDIATIDYIEIDME